MSDLTSEIPSFYDSGTPTTEGGEAPTGTEAQAPSPDQTVTVTVQGEEREVTLEELRGGYMRHADYTQKTQDLANQRKELEQWAQVAEAFRVDPRAATMAMAEYYGLDLGGGHSAPAEPQYDEWGDPIQPSQPSQQESRLLQEIEALKGQVRALTTNQAKEHIDREALTLAERYPEVDPEVAKRHAIANRLPSLELAYRDLAFDSRNEAYERERQRREAEQSIVDSKRGAGVVNPGSGPAVGSVREPERDWKAMSFADTFKAIAAENGLDLSRPDFFER